MYVHVLYVHTLHVPMRQIVLTLVDVTFHLKLHCIVFDCARKHCHMRHRRCALTASNTVYLFEITVARYLVQLGIHSSLI